MLVLKVKYNNTWTDLDLYGDESINFQKSVLEVQEFEKRSSDFTKQFRIPGTEINNRVMGNIFKINLEDSSFDPKQSLECALTISGQVLLVGSMRLEKMYVNVDKVDYEVVVYSQVGSLASAISERTLCDLDFSEYTHTLNYQNIVSSWTNGLYNGDIIYPFIHYGYDDEDLIPDFEFTETQYSFDSPTRPLPFWYYKPSIRVSKVIEKILNESGYQMNSSYLNSEEFENIYMPLSFSSDLGVQTIVDISFYASLSTSNDIPVGEHNVIFDIELSDTSNNYNNLTGEYTITAEGKYSFKVDYTLSTIDCCEYEGDPYYHLYDRFVRDRGGVKTTFDDRFLGYNCNATDVPFTKTITINVGPGQDWQIGDKISFGTKKEVEDCNSYTITSSDNNHSDIEYYACEDDTTPITLRVYAGSPETICANPDIPPVFIQHSGTIVDNGPCASIHTCDATINFLSTFLLYDTPSEPGDGSDVIINENMSCDTTQLDFLKGIFTHYNMVVVPDPDDPITLVIEPWVNWVNDSDVRVKDWTNLLDISKDVQIQPLVDNDNRYVKFTDQEDTDYLNALHQDNLNTIFGEGVYDSGSQIVQKTKTIDTIFSPTPSEQLDGSARMIVPKLYEEDDAGNLSVLSTNPRLLYYNGMIDINDTYYVRDENDVVHSHTSYPCMSIAQQLNTTSPDINVKTLSWNKVYNYYSQLSGFNTINAEGSYYELFWKDYFVDVYDSDSRLITAYFNIPYQEFLDIRLNDRIQISGLFGNTLWRINKISDYDLMDPGMTKVELIKSLIDPNPVKVKRSYLIERCDIEQQNVASYYSFEPLTPNMGVQIEGFTDCFFVIEETDLDPLTEITDVYDNCTDCELGDTGNIYVLEDDGWYFAGTEWDGYHAWETGSGTGAITFTIGQGTTAGAKPSTPDLQFEVNINGITYTTPVGDLWNNRNSPTPYEFVVNKNSSVEYIETRFINNADPTDLYLKYHITMSEVGSTTPKRIFAQSLDYSLRLNDRVYLGPNYPEHTLTSWKVIGKNSQATPEAQITEPFGNGPLTDMSFSLSGQVSYIQAYSESPNGFYGVSYNELIGIFIMNRQMIVNNDGNYSIEFTGTGTETSNVYTFYSQYRNRDISDSGLDSISQYSPSPNWNDWSVGQVVKIVGVSEEVVITSRVGPTFDSGNTDVYKKVS